MCSQSVARSLIFAKLFTLLISTIGVVLAQPLNHTLVQSKADENALSGIFQLPIIRGRRRRNRTMGHRRRDPSVGATGLGDDTDLSYIVAIQLGEADTIVDIDTGSSDLWSISSSCATSICQSVAGSSSVQPYPVSPALTANSPTVSLQFGDSTTGTHASGPVAVDTVTFAGLSLTNQTFIAVDDTDNTSVEDGAGGILGMGFPTASIVEQTVLNSQESNPTSDSILENISIVGPPVARMVALGNLAEPMFTVTLQRDTIDAGPSTTNGQLTLGALPSGVDNSSLTWVPVRLYSAAEGGISPPSFAQNEIYPLRWEVPLDAVLVDGKALPTSNIQGVTTEVSALLDTGNSIIRGPADSVQLVYEAFSNSATSTLYPCSDLHTLAFQFGGNQFPVDARDFLSPVQGSTGSPVCDAKGNLVSTDPPAKSALFSWSLGDTFLKSNLVAFYYGNLTHPSVDPPRIGFLSLVASDDGQQAAKNDVQTAAENGDHFFTTSDVAPTTDILISTSTPGATLVTTDTVTTDAFNSDSVVATQPTSSPSTEQSSTKNNSTTQLSLDFRQNICWTFILAFVISIIHL